MANNTPAGLVLFSKEQKTERALPKGMQNETAQAMLTNMFDGLRSFGLNEQPRQDVRRVAGYR
jgi:hypothetical protein